MLYFCPRSLTPSCISARACVRACVLRSAWDLGFGVESDCVVALWGPRAGSCMRLAVQLPLHEEVALLFEVEAAVSTHEAVGMPVLIPRLHDSPAAEKQETRSKRQSPNPRTKATPTDKAGGVCFTLRNLAPPAAQG